MKILVAVSEYHRAGGFPRHAADVACALARRGHDVTVLTRRAEITEEDRALSFRYFSCPTRPRTLLMALEPYLVTRQLRRLTPAFDAVISVGLASLAPGVMLGPAPHRGYLEMVRQSCPRFSLRRMRLWINPYHLIVLAWERAMLRGLHPLLIVVGRERFGDEYVEHYGFPSERIAVVPHGINLREFRFDPAGRDEIRARLGASPTTKVLLNVSARNYQKGMDALAAAANLLPRDLDWKFVFAGAGSNSPDLHARTDGLRSQGRVVTLGRVEGSLAPLYSAADVFVFPSRYDPWGMVVTEALACGLPVACSAGIGAATLLHPEKNGALIRDANDPKEIRDRVLEVLSARMDRDVVAGTVASCSWDDHAAALEKHLGQEAAGSRTKAHL